MFNFIISKKKLWLIAQLFFASAESEFEDIRNYGLNAPIARNSTWS